MVKFNKEEQSESRQFIASAIERATKSRDGKTIIYTVLRSVSRSGMMRRISAYVINDNVPVGLSWHYDRAHGRMADDTSGRWANKVGGCGMDMGFHLAGNLSSLAGGDTWSTFHHEWI